MLIEFIIVSIVWLALFLYSLFISRHDLLGTSFLVFQFVFIGAGLAMWPFVHSSAAQMFSTYDIASITFDTVFKANCILLSGVVVTYTTYQLLKQSVGFTSYSSCMQSRYFPNRKILFITFFWDLFLLTLF